jgi:hypothetical protein
VKCHFTVSSCDPSLLIKVHTVLKQNLSGHRDSRAIVALITARLFYYMGAMLDLKAFSWCPGSAPVRARTDTVPAALNKLAPQTGIG